MINNKSKPNQRLKSQKYFTSFGREFSKNKVLFLMLLPAVTLAIVFSYIPMAGIIIAFKNYQYNLGMFKSPWVGVNNFKYFFESGSAWMLTKNTLLYNSIFIIVGTTIRIMMAILIYEMCSNWYKKIMQTLMFLPHFLSWVIIGGLAYNVFNYEFGIINSILTSLGGDKVDFYNNPGYWKYILTFVNVWQSTGYGMIFYLAAITGIDTNLYDAAYIDGAGLMKRIWHVTLPLIKPTTVILLLLSLGGILKGNFQMFYQLIGNNGQLFAATDVIDTYVFRSLTNIQDFGLTTAAGLYQQVIGFALVITANYAVRKINPESSLF